MQALENSFIYKALQRLILWVSGCWNSSIVVNWFTHQSMVAGTIQDRICGPIRNLWTKICEKLHLGKLLEGSIFLHPALFTAGAVLLAPIMPTMVILALICAAFFSMVLKFGVDTTATITKSPLNVYVLLYAVVYLYATLTSVTLSGSLFAGLLTILFVMAFFCVTSCGLSRKQLRLLLALMMAAGVLVSLYGFYQLMFPDHFRSVWTDEDMFSSITFRVYSTLENPNVLGEYFLLVIPLGAAMFMTAEGKLKKFMYLVACGIMGICLVLTYSRGCYLGLLFAAAVFLVLLDRRFIILGIVAVALCPLYLPESVISRFTSIGNMDDTSTSYRVYIWLGTLAMLKDYWFCGVGPGIDAYNLVYPHYAYNTITAPHSHNLYLQIMCDTGFCGIVIFLLLLLSFYRMMFTAIRTEKNREARLFQIAGTATVSGFLVQSMTDYTFYNYRVLLLFWVVLGLCVLFCRMGKIGEAQV